MENLIAKRKESIDLLDELVRSTFLEMFWNVSAKKSWPKNTIESYALDKKGSMRTGPFGSDLLHDEFADEGDVMVLGIDNVVNNYFERGKPRYISIEKFEKLKRYRVNAGDVLISIMATNGRSAVVPNDIPMAINTKHLAAISLNEKKMLPYYLKYAFQYHPQVERQLLSNMKGAIMRGLNLTIIKSIELRNPPLALQNRFAKFAIGFERLREGLQSHLTELENLYGSLSQRAFKGALDLDSIAIDHIIPRNKGGSDEFENLQLLTLQDNIRKKDMMPDEWLERKARFDDHVYSQLQPVEPEPPRDKEERPKDKILTDPVTVSQFARWMKEEFTGKYFTTEMFIRFCKEEQLTHPYYFTSKELKENRKVDEALDLKKMLFDAIQGKNDFIRLKQEFINAEINDVLQLVRPEDRNLLEEKEPEMRSGIYLKVIDET